MKHLTPILGGALAVQLVLAAALSFSGSDHAAFKAQEPLLAFDPGKIDQVNIDENGKASVALKKSDGAWILPAMSDFPAYGHRMEDLLGKLAALKKGWPVATSAEAAERFKVSENAHERRILLKAGGEEVGEVLLGTSPAFKQIHARVKGDDKVYTVTLATYDAGARAEDWMNREYLNLPDDKIASISVNDVTLERKDNKFVVPGMQEGEKLAESDVQKLVGAVSSPVFDAVLGKGSDTLSKLNEPDTQVTIKRADGGTIIYKYKKDPSGGGYLFGSSDHDFLFKVADATVEPIVQAKRDKLVEAKKNEGADAQTSTKPGNGSGG